MIQRMPGNTMLAADAHAVAATSCGLGLEIDVEEIARVCRLHAEQSTELLEGYQGLYSQSHGQRTVYVNTLDPRELQRLTIAHALAHVRYGDRDCCTINTMGLDSPDLRAVYYAGHLLVPDEALRRSVDELEEGEVGAVAHLAVLFRVPYYTLHWRLVELLGITSEVFDGAVVPFLRAV